MFKDVEKQLKLLAKIVLIGGIVYGLLYMYEIGIGFDGPLMYIFPLENIQYYNYYGGNSRSSSNEWFVVGFIKFAQIAFFSWAISTLINGFAALIGTSSHAPKPKTGNKRTHFQVVQHDVERKDRMISHNTVSGIWYCECGMENPINTAVYCMRCGKKKTE